MRVALFGLNLVALGAATAPAIMLFQTVAQAHALDPIMGQTFFVLLGAGVALCLVAAAALTKRRNPNPELAIRLLSLAALSFAGAIAWSVALMMVV